MTQTPADMPKDLPVSQPEAPPLTKEAFLTFLDQEILTTRSEQERPGWTTWALVGALATVSWLFLNALSDSPTPSLQGIGVAYLLLNLGIISARMLYSALAPENQFFRPPQQRFSFWAVFHGPSRAFYALSFLNTGVLAFLTLTLPDLGLAVYQMVILCTIFILVCLILVLVIALSFARIPYVLDAPREPLWRRLAYILLASITIWIILTMVVYRYGHSSNPSVPDWRSAARIFSSFFIITRIVTTQHRHPMLSALIATRRSLALGHIDLQAAIRQSDIAIAGLHLADVVADNIDRILNLGSEIAQGVYTAMIHINAAGEMAAKPDASENAIKVLLDSAKSSLDNIEGLVGRAEKEIRHFGRRIGLAHGQKGKTYPEEDAIKQKVSIAMGMTLAAYVVAKTKYEEVAAKIKASARKPEEFREEFRRSSEEFRGHP